MINITHKSSTLRKAIALAIVKVSKQETIDAIINKSVAKGDVFEMSKTAGLFAVKKTSDVIPDCHPLPIEFSSIEFEIVGLEIKINVEVHTIYKTGVEVEAMHGASVVALTMYDMLKPIDKGIEIHSIKLLKKSGGKSDLKKLLDLNINAVVVVCSDSVSRGKKEDSSGKEIVNQLNKLNISVLDYQIIPDEKNIIEESLQTALLIKPSLIIFTGGTGIYKRDISSDTIKPFLEKEIPGIMEQARRYGQERMPYAMLSRGIAGIINETLIITLPGSINGVKESMDALFPNVLHAFEVLKGSTH